MTGDQLARGRALAVCYGEACDWQGYRVWPSEPRPCPRCGGTVRRVLPGRASNARGERRDVEWSDPSAATA